MPNEITVGCKVVVTNSRGNRWIQKISEETKACWKIVEKNGYTLYSKSTLRVRGGDTFYTNRIRFADKDMITEVTRENRKNTLVKKFRNVNWSFYTFSELVRIDQLVSEYSR